LLLKDVETQMGLSNRKTDTQLAIDLELKITFKED
jgi:hypothetical protein